MLHAQLKGEKPLNIFLPVIYNVESQIYCSLPAFTTPARLWRCVFELEKNELIHRDYKKDKYKRENLEDDAEEDNNREEDVESISSNDTTSSSLPDLVPASSSEEEEEKEEEQPTTTTSNIIMKEILKLF
jgi:hypothetical protein